MKRILISEDAFGDPNDGFLFHEAKDFGLDDYFTACLRSDIEGLKVTVGIHSELRGFHRVLSRNHAVGDAIKARLGSVCPGGTAVPAVLSDREGRDARAPWPRANSLSKQLVISRPGTPLWQRRKRQNVLHSYG